MGKAREPQPSGESILHVVLREEMCAKSPKWGVQQLADALGVKYTVASRWVAEDASKRVIPTTATLIRIADVFGLSVVDVFRYAGFLPAMTDGHDPDDEQIQKFSRRIVRILRKVPPEHRQAALIMAAVSLDHLQLLLDRLYEVSQ
jgi:transcriptional regulator with XRE-family HTH domain